MDNSLIFSLLIKNLKIKNYGNLNHYLIVLSYCIIMEFEALIKAIDAFKNGEPVVVMDDEDRENEGDLIIGAQFMTPEKTTFFVNHTTGILCVAMDKWRAKQLGLPKMVKKNSDPKRTAFTVTCDHITCTTGVSSTERCKTITSLADPSSTSQDFSKPGHIFPLIAVKSGLFERRGHTEASVELCKLANIYPVAALSELKNDDGTMKRFDDCKKFAQDNNLHIITIDKLKQFMDSNIGCRVVAETKINIDKYGKWSFYCYHSGYENPHRVLIKGYVYNSTEPVLVRVHSECFTGDVLSSLMCDCGDQLEMAKRIISENGKGVIIFPANHEGRGIGLTNKIRAYKVIKKNKDIDTYQANNILGFPDDCRKYDDVVKIIDDLRINKINLLSNNSEKIAVLKDKIEVITPLLIRPNPHNQKYLEAKSKKQTVIDFNQITVSAYQKNYNIAIITTEWHNDLMETYCDQIKTEIQKFCNIQQIHVPGSYEIPLCASKLIASGKFDAIICTGIIVTSHGNHFEYESNAIKNALLKMQLKYDFPIINGVLNCRKFEEIQERINPKNGLAKSIALTTINMCSLQNRINTI